MTITTLGIDIAKSVFQLHGVDADGAVILQKKLRRGAVLDFLGKLGPCLIGMEACATSHFWAREIAALGHDVRLIPPAYVKPYVKRQKNDAADAEAICEAVTRPNMRFVPVKTEEQQGVLVLHRSRDLLMRQRTMILNAIRAHFAEFGIITAQGPRKVSELVIRLRDDDSLGLPEVARSALVALAVQLDSLATEVRNIDRRLMAWHRQSAASQRLETIPGVGLITATALAASVPDPAAFKSGRHFAAYLGLVPETKLIGGQGPSRAYIEDGQRLLASVAGCWRYFGHSAGTNHRHPNRSLGPIAPRAQTDTARHSGHRQQDPRVQPGRCSRQGRLTRPHRPSNRRRHKSGASSAS